MLADFSARISPVGLQTMFTAIQFKEIDNGINLVVASEPTCIFFDGGAVSDGLA